MSWDAFQLKVRVSVTCNCSGNQTIHEFSFLLLVRDVETSSEEYDLPALKNIYKNETLAGKDMSHLLDAVFKTYDKRIRPLYDGRS